MTAAALERKEREQEKEIDVSELILKCDAQEKELEALEAENKRLKEGSISGRSSARPSLSQIQPTRQNSTASRPISRATSYIEGLDIDIDKDSPYYCKHCEQLKNNLGSILNDPRNYGLPTTSDDSYSEKEGKPHHNSAPGGRGRGRGYSKRPSVSDFEHSQSDSSHPKRSESDGSNFFNSPTNSFYGEVISPYDYNLLKGEIAEKVIENKKLQARVAELENKAKDDKEQIAELNRIVRENDKRIDELNQKIEDDSRDLKLAEQREIIIQATDPVNKINSISKNLKRISQELENLNVVEDNFSLNEGEKNDEVNPSETTPIIIVSDETTQATQENVPLIPRERDLSKEKKEEIKAQAAQLTDPAKAD
ncbi:14022_t:CDS:2 [Cetraspora pellucida]|uniref:14022_t:CDS:1 n=1 Tax=Cetraspora pellucida TaxID=1433469 RepID=A0ACA9PM15_9GLOM|nr:14022_t:CDS:2 [Cetraspora pellucida]